MVARPWRSSSPNWKTHSDNLKTPCHGSRVTSRARLTCTGSPWLRQRGKNMQIVWQVGKHLSPWYPWQASPNSTPTLISTSSSRITSSYSITSNPIMLRPFSSNYSRCRVTACRRCGSSYSSKGTAAGRYSRRDSTILKLWGPSCSPNIRNYHPITSLHRCRISFIKMGDLTRIT